MDSRIPDIRPIGMEPWIIQDHVPKESRSIPPVPEGEGGSFNRLSNESGKPQNEGSPVVSRDNAEQLAKSAQNYLDDLNIGINIEVHDESGDILVKVINRETKEVIRQIPPEALVRLRDHLRDLVGALFSEKA